MEGNKQIHVLKRRTGVCPCKHYILLIPKSGLSSVGENTGLYF